MPTIRSPRRSSWARPHRPSWLSLETIPPFGVEANRKALQLAIDWALEQRMIARRLEVDELFDETTRGLVP